MNQLTIAQIAAGLLVGQFLLGNTSIAATISNGSFEAPLIAPNSEQSGTPTSWSWASSVGFIFNGTVFYPLLGSNWPSPQSGSQFIDIGNVSTFSLTQSFVATSSEFYRLTWYDNAHSAGLTSPYTAQLTNAAAQLVASASLDAAHGGIWQQRTLTFSVVPGTYTVAFTAQGQPQGFDTLLDNVTLTPVPELASAVSLSLGLAVVFAAATRRRLR